MAKKATTTPKASSPRTAPPVDALDIIAEMEQAATLNKFFDDNPEPLTDDDLLRLVQNMRQERAHIEKE